jgi:hypothetical protein
MVSPQLRKQVVVVMPSEVEVSERRACGLPQIHRGMYRYRRRPEDGRLRARLRVLAEERRRFGYHGCRWPDFWKAGSLGRQINRVITEHEKRHSLSLAVEKSRLH